MKGMLFSQMEPPPPLEAEFNDWYESEHIPVRLALPGFAHAVRYRELDATRKYLAIYEIDDLGVLESPGYHVVKTQPSERTARMLNNVNGFTRFTCSQVADTGESKERGRYLSALAFAVPKEKQASFQRWCEGELVPRLARDAATIRVRIYSVISGDGGPWTEFVLREVGSIDALEVTARPEWAADGAAWRYEAISMQSATRQEG